MNSRDMMEGQEMGRVHPLNLTTFKLRLVIIDHMKNGGIVIKDHTMNMGTEIIDHTMTARIVMNAGTMIIDLMMNIGTGITDHMMSAITEVLISRYQQCLGVSLYII